MTFKTVNVSVTVVSSCKLAKHEYYTSLDVTKDME